MTYDEALEFFGSGRSIGLALRVSSSRVSQCRAAGGFSYPMQCVLEKESGGKLSAAREHEPANTPNKATVPANDWRLVRPGQPTERTPDPPPKKTVA